jgi:redox-sensitive bicupin YhaK (pirin superfamily)
VIHQDLTMYASILEKDVEVKHHFEKGRKGYIHVTKTGGNVLLNGDIELKEGDGAFLTDLDDLTIKGTTDKAAEFVLFDLSSTEPDFL